MIGKTAERKARKSRSTSRASCRREGGWGGRNRKSEACLASLAKHLDSDGHQYSGRVFAAEWQQLVDERLRECGKCPDSACRRSDIRCARPPKPSQARSPLKPAPPKSKPPSCELPEEVQNSDKRGAGQQTSRSALFSWPRLLGAVDPKASYQATRERFSHGIGALTARRRSWSCLWAAQTKVRPANDDANEQAASGASHAMTRPQNDSVSVHPPSEAWIASGLLAQRKDTNSKRAEALIAEIEDHLGNTQHATLKDRKKLFRGLQRRMHPDKNADLPEASKVAFQHLMERETAYLT